MDNSKDSLSKPDKRDFLSVSCCVCIISSVTLRANEFVTLHWILHSRDLLLCKTDDVHFYTPSPISTLSSSIILIIIWEIHSKVNKIGVGLNRSREKCSDYRFDLCKKTVYYYCVGGESSLRFDCWLLLVLMGIIRRHQDYFIGIDSKQTHRKVYRVIGHAPGYSTHKQRKLFEGHLRRHIFNVNM